MTMRRAGALALLLGAASALPKVAAAQSFVPQPQEYMLTTDAGDARALWVQPAGLGKTREASIAALFTANRIGGNISAGQYGLTIASGVLAFGWQHDRLRGGNKSDAFVVGLAGGTPEFSIGADRRWYRGTNTKDGSWDLGARYMATWRLETSLVWRDLGSPVVVGDTIFSTLVAGASFALLPRRLQVGADWEVVTRSWNSSALRLGATLTLPASLALSVRSEFTNKLSGRSIAVALTWRGAGARVTGFESSVRDPDVDRVGAWGAAVSSPQRRRLGG